MQADHPGIPWPQIIAFRNIVIHEYFGLDLELVWEIIANEIGKLAIDLETILKSLDEE